MKPTRREVVAAVPASLMAAAQGAKIRLGGPIFLKTEDPREMARECRRLGYSAAYCPKADLKDPAGIRAIQEAFSAENVVIAEVGAWVNMLDVNNDKRKENMKYVGERLALAEEVAARCCVTIAGSYNPSIWYGPNPKNISKEFFDATVENCRRLIDEVKPKRTKFTIEMMGWSLPEGPDEYVALIKAVDRGSFGVHLDPCNGINSPNRFYDNGGFITECFRKLGPWLASCHAKDLEWVVEMNVHFKEVIPGRGQIDYRSYLKGLASLPVEVPLMLEHLKSGDEYTEGAQYIRRVGGELGLTFA